MSTPADSLAAQVADLYGNRLRVRVCGLYREGDRLLMVRHRGLGPTGVLWLPPGGGVDFSETGPEALSREFAEETGLQVVPTRLICVNEHLVPPLHALELVFEVQRLGGELRVGHDPEMPATDQLITDVRLMTFAQLNALPAGSVHSLFARCQSIDALFSLTGYFNQR